MAGTLGVSVTEYPDAGIVKYALLWGSDGSGNVNGHQSDLATLSGGLLTQARVLPFAGPLAPTALYDVTLTDANGIDFLGGLGANLSATVGRYILPTVRMYRDDAVAIDFVVTNAGASKFGLVSLYFRATPHV